MPKSFQANVGFEQGAIGVRPLLQTKKGLYQSRGLELLFHDRDRTQRIATLPGSSKVSLFTSHWFVNRVLRLGFHFLMHASDGSLFGIVKGAIVRIDPLAKSIKVVFEPPRGSRPLNMCEHGGKFYFGEYFGNSDRESVHVYGSGDGNNWQSVYEFSAGTIRHVHGLVSDRYRDSLLVLTGDDDDEAAIWSTSDDFASLDTIARGSQQARAVTVFPVQEGLIVPMDSPQERNFVNFLENGSDRFRSLAPMQGSCLYGATAGGLMLLGTCVERSDVNKSRYASLLASEDGFRWHEIFLARRDFEILSRLPAYLQHPVLIPVAGPSSAEQIHVFAIGVKDFDGRGLRFDTDEIKRYLREIDA